MPVLLGLLVALLTMPELIQITQAPEWEKIRQRVNELNPSAVLTPGEAADAAARSLRPYEVLQALAQRGAINDDQFRLMVDARIRRPDVDFLAAAMFRGEINGQDFDQALSQLGFDENGRKVIRSAIVGLYTPADLISWLTRDVFIPEFVERFGMDLEYPTDADAHFEKIGIPKDVARLHWRAHWELPSVTQGTEMFQRSIIDETDFRRLLRARGVEPFWRDSTIAILYNPITRVDIRRLHALGLLDHAGLVRKYRDTGYSPDNAELLAKFTEQLNRSSKLDQARKISSSIVGHVLTALGKGTLDEAEARTQLVALGVTTEEADVLIQEEAIQRELTQQERVEKLIADYYVSELWDETQTRTQLAARGFTAKEISALLAVWKLERDLHALKAGHHAARELTKAEILEAYADRILTRAEAKQHLLDLRYDDATAELEISLAEHKQAKAELRDLIEAVHQRFRGAKISDTAAALELDKLGVTSTHREALLARWTAESHAKQADLTIAQLEQIARKSIWTRLQVEAYLPRLGYDAEERAALVALFYSA